MTELSAARDAPAPVAPPAQPEQTVWHPSRDRRIAVAVGIACAVAAILLVCSAWRLLPNADAAETTDNAYVRGRVTVISPQVSGYVLDVPIRDYQQVVAGQILVRIDDSVYRARVEQAQANLAAARAALANSAQSRASRVAALGGQDAGIAAARAQLGRATADMRRASELAGDGSISIRELDQTRAAMSAADAQLRQALAAAAIGREDVRSVDVGKGGLEAQVEAAAAQVHAAQIDLGHTVIRAPENGRAGEIGVRVGAYVTNGTQLLSVVPVERWVIANFKEAQMARIAPGQRVAFTIDALGDRSFEGRVESLSPAAGSEFAVLKPDNATGNFVKIPQRIGVRIAIDAHQPDVERIKPGMSVSVTIHEGKRP